MQILLKQAEHTLLISAPWQAFWFISMLMSLEFMILLSVAEYYFEKKNRIKKYTSMTSSDKTTLTGSELNIGEGRFICQYELLLGVQPLIADLQLLYWMTLPV